jgi:hypothetical protein
LWGGWGEGAKEWAAELSSWTAPIAVKDQDITAFDEVAAAATCIDETVSNKENKPKTKKKPKKKNTPKKKKKRVAQKKEKFTRRPLRMKRLNLKVSKSVSTQAPIIHKQSKGRILFQGASPLKQGGVSCSSCF